MYPPSSETHRFCMHEPVRIDRTPPQGMVFIAPDIVANMGTLLENLKPDHVMDRLGISLNTWHKIKSGEPVRASLAHRIIVRFANSFECS